MIILLCYNAFLARDFKHFERENHHLRLTSRKALPNHSIVSYNASCSHFHDTLGFTLNRITTALLIIISALYPIIVYLSIEKAGPALLGLGLCVVAVLRLILSKSQTDTLTLTILVAAVLYGLVTALANQELLVRLYPVLISWALGAAFALSTRDDMSLIEKFARKMGQEITDNAKRYTRKLSLVWGLFLFANGLVALILALGASLKLWALYSGFVSYLLIASLVLGELIYRRFYIAKYGP